MSSGDSRLGATTRRTIEQGLQDFYPAVFAISFWEVGMRVDKGQLGLNTDLLSWRRGFLDTGISEVTVDGEIAARAGLLPLLHGDPVDRLIVATGPGRPSTGNSGPPHPGLVRQPPPPGRYRMTTPQTNGNGPVPDDWRWVQLGEFFKLEYGVSMP